MKRWGRRLQHGGMSAARDNFTKAFELSGRTSERERFVIAPILQMVTGEIEKAIENFQLWCKLSARRSRPRELGGLYGEETGRFEECLWRNSASTAIGPELPRGKLRESWSVLQALNRLQDAKAINDKALAQGLADDPLIRVNFFGVAYSRGDTAEMDRQLAWSGEKPHTEETLLAAKIRHGGLFRTAAVGAEYSRRASDARPSQQGK